jgi:hypothetical protein
MSNQLSEQKQFNCELDRLPGEIYCHLHIEEWKNIVQYDEKCNDACHAKISTLDYSKFVRTV